MIKGGPKIVTDGLKLCLDAHDAKSYAGEPTTNVVTYTNLNTGWSKSYQSNIVYDDIEPPAGINSQVVGHTRGSNSGYWYSYGDYAPQDPSVVYVVSMYVKTLDSNFRINFYTADNSETGRYWSSYITVPNDGKWHRVVWDSFTNPSNSQSDSLSFNFSYNGAIGNASTKTWFCAPQMEAKSYATPFVIGTRSLADGWKNRATNSNDGDIYSIGTGVTHYRDGEVIMPVSASYIDFDGSDDLIGLPAASNFFSPDLAWEIWVKSTGLGSGMSTGGLFSVDYGQLMQINSSGNLRVAIYNYDGASAVSYLNTTFTMSPSLFNGEWRHILVTLGGSTDGTYEIYIDGVKEYNGSVTTGWSGNSNWGTLPARIGENPNNNVYHLLGQVGLFRLYHKHLTQAEALSNYNATKGRFS